MRQLRISSSILGCLLIAATLVSAGDDKKQEKKRKPKFTVGKETTYITEPLDADGFPDHVAALNERMRKGVTPDNNANVLLCKAFGPRPEGTKLPARYYEWMGIREPAEKGSYFVSAREFWKGEVPDNDLWEQFTERPWAAKEHPDFAAWLEQNAKPLALAVEATKRPRYFHPLVPGVTKDGRPAGLIGALTPGAQKCREAGTCLAMRAMRALGEARTDDAWQDLLACHRLGRLVGHGGTLIELLVDVAIESLAAKSTLAFLESPQLKSPRVRDCLRDLQNLPPRSTVAEKIDLGERFMFLDTTINIARDGPDLFESLVFPLANANPKPASGAMKSMFQNIDWDPALRTANRYYDRMAEALRTKDRTEREKETARIDIEIKELKASLFQRSPVEKVTSIFFPLGMTAEARGKNIGNILIGLLMPAQMKLQQASDRIEQTERNLKVAFALAAYQRDNGKYPDKLDALAPKYLKEIPLDLYSGTPLIYRLEATGYLLYSGGVNGKDDGGRSSPYEDPPGDDLVVRMPLPELRKQR